MHALQFAHPRVLDTAVIFRTDGRKHSLRHLSLVLLKRSIQNNSINVGVQPGPKKMGHCSIEDAESALELAVKRVQHGSSFKLHNKSRGRTHLMELVDTVRKGHDGDQAFAITREKGAQVCIGSSKWIKDCVSTRCSAHALICEDISSSSRNAITAWLRSERRRASLLIANMAVSKESQLSLIGEVMVGFLSFINTLHQS